MNKIAVLLIPVLVAGCGYATIANSTDVDSDVAAVSPSPLAASGSASSSEQTLLAPAASKTPVQTESPTATPTATATAAPTATATPTVEPSPTPEPTPQIVKITGTQTHGNSKKFSLSGDYTVTVTGKAKSDNGSGIELGGGNLVVQLIGDLTFDPIVNEIVKGGQSYTFTTFEYKLSPGTYYLTLLIPAGSWAVTFVPIVQ